MNNTDSVFDLINKLPKPIPFLIGDFAFSEDDRFSLESYTFGPVSLIVDPPAPPRDHNSLPFLYESLNFSGYRNRFPDIEGLASDSKAVVLSHTFKVEPAPQEGNRLYRTRGTVRRIDRQFQWVVKRWPKVNWKESIEKRYEHFYCIDWTESEFLGAHHRNRFVRGTKVLIQDGPFEGQHAVVVGFHQNWNITFPSPRLNLYLGGGVTTTVFQYRLKLLDPHGYLPFAVPFDNSFGSTA